MHCGNTVFSDPVIPYLATTTLIKCGDTASSELHPSRSWRRLAVGCGEQTPFITAVLCKTMVGKSIMSNESHDTTSDRQSSAVLYWTARRHQARITDSSTTLCRPLWLINSTIPHTRIVDFGGTLPCPSVNSEATWNGSPFAPDPNPLG